MSGEGKFTISLQPHLTGTIGSYPNISTNPTMKLVFNDPGGTLSLANLSGSLSSLSAVQFPTLAVSGSLGSETWTPTVATYSLTYQAPGSGVINLPRTGQTTSFAPRDDGAVLAGVEWPVPRLVDNGDQTVTDALNGLIWAQDGGTPTVDICTGGAKTWQDALDYVACLNGRNYLGHNDWRLPNIVELQSLLAIYWANPFWPPAEFANVNPGTDAYWSSSTDPSFAHFAYMNSTGGYSENHGQKIESHLVWPVRGGASGSPDPSFAANLPKTGQTVSYYPGDDGAVKTGVSWPVPRFTDNGDGTVADRLTGLVWLRNAGCFGEVVWADALTTANGLTSGQCGLSDGSVAGDWRLPNREELSSLLDLSSNLGLPAGDFFTDVQFAYWSSSTLNDVFSWNAFQVDFRFVGTGLWFHDKTFTSSSVWPVRNALAATPTPVDGVCGSSNGQKFMAAPATNLCSTGTASAVAGSGPWTWTCAGLNGGTTAGCSAALNHAPTISGVPNTAVAVGYAYGFLPQGKDSDVDPLTFSIVNKPAWASFNAATGRLSGVPASGDTGINSNIVISVSDGLVSVPLAAFSISVSAPGYTGPATLTVPVIARNTVQPMWRSIGTGYTYVLQYSPDATTWTTAYTGTGIAATVYMPASGSYTFRVKATKSGLPDTAWTYGTNSCVVTVVCVAPPRFSISATSTTGNVLTSWPASSTPGVTYVVEYSKDGTNWNTGYSGTALSATVTVPTSGTYAFRVKATKASCLDSGWTTPSWNCVVTKR